MIGSKMKSSDFTILLLQDHVMSRKTYQKARQLLISIGNLPSYL